MRLAVLLVGTLAGSLAHGNLSRCASAREFPLSKSVPRMMHGVLAEAPVDFEIDQDGKIKNTGKFVSYSQTAEKTVVKYKRGIGQLGAQGTDTFTQTVTLLRKEGKVQKMIIENDRASLANAYKKVYSPDGAMFAPLREELIFAYQDGVCKVDQHTVKDTSNVFKNGSSVTERYKYRISDCLHIEFNPHVFAQNDSPEIRGKRHLCADYNYPGYVGIGSQQGPASRSLPTVQ